MGLNLRPYQEATLDALRKGFLEGNKCQILYAPTGAGKTEMAIALLEATRVKGNRAAMILDRIVLCDQTSQRLEKYSIEHGVLQSGHWRYRPDELIQVCSAQTLERRGEFPGLNLLIIDECHQTRQQTIQFIKDNPKVHVVGLTATPFTQGLAHTYKSVVSTVTTKDLVNQEVLVPLRVFIAKEINMVGAKKVAGEWSVADVTRRGKKITGDIVNEWVKKTFEVFGKPSKTIVFCSGVAHGTDLARSFQEQGYNFINISYQDDDKFKAEVIEDFSKPDTEIVGLIATDILTKGFDVPDVMIGVSARPFSKSLSSHIQQMGRVMRGCKGKDFALWLCLAKGSRVLTDRGLVAIDKVTLAHKIWDGTNFVTHKGAVCNGIQKTITYQGLTATAGHLVHTSKGWRTFGECAREQIRITQTGFDGQTIRIGDDLRSTSFLVGRTAKKIYSCFVRMCDLWIQKFNLFIKSAIWQNQRMPNLQSAGAGLSNVALQPSASHESQMLQSIKRTVSSLWRQRGGIQILGSQRGNSVDHESYWHSGFFQYSRAISHSNRSNQSKWSLRARKFALAFCGIKSAKQTWQSSCGTHPQIQTKLSGYSLFRQHFEAFLLGWHDGCSDHRALSQAIHEAEREVWDILDAGQHNRFTCEGLLVHNCHSGNYLRFREDWEEVYENGVHELDDGKEKTKVEPTDKEKSEAKCPVCEAYFPAYMDMCSNCGHVRERRNQIEAVPGEMEEITTRMTREDKQLWWSMLQYYVQFNGWKVGRAANVYKEKFGVWPRGLDDTVVIPSPELRKFVDDGIKKYIRAIRRAR